MWACARRRAHRPPARIHPKTSELPTPGCVIHIKKHIISLHLAPHWECWLVLSPWPFNTSALWGVQVKAGKAGLCAEGITLSQKRHVGNSLGCSAKKRNKKKRKRKGNTMSRKKEKEMRREEKKKHKRRKTMRRKVNK